jgi:archaemetzincin
VISSLGGNHEQNLWSIYRKGDPSRSKKDFERCLLRTLATATHETCHILTMEHCIAHACNINGSNSLPEADSRPLHPCPVCLRKLCWNLQLEPVAYLKKHQAFCRKNGLQAEAEWFEKAAVMLARGKGEER